MGKTNTPVFNSRTESSRDDWETPPELVENIVSTFNISYDMAASGSNAIADAFFTENDSALDICWKLNERLFCNPPFSLKEHFLAKAVPARNGNEVIVFLLPNTARGARWWIEHVANEADEIINLVGRVNYCLNGEAIKPGANFDSCLVIYRPRMKGYCPGLPKETYCNWR